MPIDTEQWRAQTGLFCASRVLLRPPRCKQPQPKVQANTLSLNIKFSLAVLLVAMRTGIFYASRTLQLLCLITCHASWLLSSVVRLSCRRLRGVSVLLALCLVVVQMLLIMSGDVEENPGPPKIRTTSLGENDLGRVFDEVMSANHNWFNLGLKLKLNVTTLVCVRDQYTNPSTALREMLLHWLKTADPPPTWEGLACALESHTVGESRLAEQLRTKYCKTEEAAGAREVSMSSSETVSLLPKSITASISGSDHDVSVHQGQNDTSSNFPYLDIRKLSEQEELALHCKLLKDSDNIMHEFNDLTHYMIKSIDSSCVSVQELHTRLSGLGTYMPIHHKQVPLLRDQLDKIERAENVEGVFSILHKYYSFFNYVIIEKLIGWFGTPEDKERLETYTENFKMFCKRRTFECPPDIFGPVDKGKTNLVVKVEESWGPAKACPLETVVRLRISLGDILGVKPWTLYLCRIDDGCMELLFQVPSFVEEDIFPLSRVQERSLTAVGVTRLTCGNYGFPQPPKVLVPQRSAQAETHKRGKHEPPDLAVTPSNMVAPIPAPILAKPLTHSPVDPVNQQRKPLLVSGQTSASHSPIYGPVPSSPAHTAVDQYASYLRSVYTSKKWPTDCKWPPTATKKYIHLAVVKKEQVSKQQADEFTKSTLHGNIDDICKKKQAVDFTQIGKQEDGTPAKLILIEGAPGIGKSTFSWKVCRKWAKREILTEYGIVVLIRLRDKRVQEIKCVADLFYHSDREFQNSVAKEIQHHHGKSVLLLFEGYDDFPRNLQMQQSIFLDILHKDFLPHATILITSRPSATKYLHWKLRRQMSQHIEILGFTEKDIVSYVNDAIKDEHVCTDFLQYLKCYPYIRGMMYVPLNAVIVTEVYQSSRQGPDEFIPTTMTELYTALTRSLLLRYILSHSEYGQQEWTLKKFSDLPQKLYEQFNRICEIALKGMIEDKFVHKDLPQDFNTLDLMQSVPELYVEQGALNSYNFFHLTLQEFLAAMRISQKPIQEQIYFINRYYDYEDSDYQEDQETTAMEIPIESDTTSLDLPILPLPEPHQHQHLIPIVPSHSHLMQSPLHLPTPHGMPDHPHLPFHQATLRSELELHDTMESEARFQNVLRFVAGLTKYENIPPDALKHVVVERHEEHVASISLNSLYWLFEARCINIYCDLVQNVTSLQYNSRDTSMAPFDCFVLGYALSHITFTGHWEIDMNRSHVDDECVEMLAGGANFMSSTGLTGVGITKLVLSRNNITDRGAATLAEMLKENRTLQQLNISDNSIGGEGATALAETLKENRTLRQLEVTNNSIGDEGATTLAEMLKENKTLQQLNISGNSIGSEGATALAEMLKENRTLQQLDVSHNSIGSGGGTALAEMLKENRTLQQLDVSFNSIGSGGATALAEMLKESRILQQLMVNGNSIGDGGATALAEIQWNIDANMAYPGESKMLESSSTAHEGDTPYRAMITYLSRQLEAQGVGTAEIRTAMQRLLPSRDLSILNSWTILDFPSLHSYLSDRQMCSPIEVDVILRLLLELEQHGLINQVLDYTESLREKSLVGTTHASPVMEDCLLLYVCYKNPAALKVESVWDEKHRLCEVLVAERHQFWFIGYEENPVITFVWQFPSTMFDSCTQRVQQQCTQLLQSDVTSIRCLHLNRCNTLFDANVACPGPIVDSLAVKRPRIECPTPPLQSGDHDTPPPAKRKPPIVPERGGDSNTEHSESSQEDFDPRFMDNPDQHDCRALLNRYQPDFVTYLDLPSLIPYLNRHSLLTRQQDELLRNEHHTKQDRVLKLLEYIEGKGPEGYKKFVQALREERTHMGHKELYKCLTKTEPRFLLPRDTLIKTLKKIYSGKDWYRHASGSNPNTDLKYIRLALIKKARIFKTERSTSRFLKDSLLGNVDDIERQKVSLKNIKEIFNYGRASQRKRVLVEGKPGIGKTMLAFHMSAEWAKGKMLQEYDCVLLVPLRQFQRKVQTSKSIPEYQMQRELGMTDLVNVYLGGEQGIQAGVELIRSGGEKSLLILEGWDELPPELREEGSFFFRILSGQLFPKASVLVTSRPTVSADLYPFMTERRIEVIGFSRKQIRQYIEKHVPSKKEIVFKHLQKFPNIEKLAHIPMTLCTICKLITAGYMESLPSTLTELYDIYMRDILYTGLKKQARPEFKHIKGISELCKLPGESQQVLVSLTKLALQGLQKSKFVFEVDDLIAVGLKPEGTFDGYGLLSTFPCYVGAGYDLLYQFGHLTIQEFLAAKGIEHLDHSQQMSILNEYRSEKEFQVVWKFLSGITKLEDEKLRDAIVLGTKRRNNQDQLFLLHCVYEAHITQLCSTAANYLEHKLCLDNCALNSTDCLCAAYIIAQAGGEWEVDLRGCHMGGEGLETLRYHLVEHQNPNAPPVKLSKLDLMANSLHLHPDPTEPSELLDPQPYGMVVLAAVIEGSIPVVELGVNSTEFGDDGAAILTEALCHNTTIRDISIATCGITAKGAKHLADMLLRNTTVKSLFLRWNKLGDDGVQHLASALEKNSTLTELSIGDNCMGPLGLFHLCEMLKVNGTLEILRIEKSQLAPGDCRLLSGMFPHNDTIQSIDMTKIPIGDDGLDILVESLKASPNSGIRTLGLFGCGITDRGVEKICELIRTNRLEAIQLGRNPGITDIGAQCLAKALECNTSVKTIRLEDANVTGKGKTSLDQVCKSREGLDITYQQNAHLWQKLQDKHQRPAASD